MLQMLAMRMGPFPKSISNFMLQMLAMRIGSFPKSISNSQFLISNYSNATFTIEKILSRSCT